MKNVEQYLAILQQALAISEGFYMMVKDVVDTYAQQDLTPQEYADLQDRWHVDALRAAANAGIDPTL